MWASYGLSWPAQDYFRTDVFLSASHQEVQAILVGVGPAATSCLYLSGLIQPSREPLSQLPSPWLCHSAAGR